MVAPRHMPVSSASAELIATVVCVLDQAFVRWLPILATPPDVERLVRSHPAKSRVNMQVKIVVAGLMLKAPYKPGLVH